jgi:hypothetical protein
MSSYYATAQVKAVDKTKTGLLVISIGFFVSWVPILGYIAWLFELAGAILVIQGRRAFGSTHARNIIWSIVIFIVALISAAGVGVAIFFSALANPQYNSNSGPPSLSSFMALFSVGVIVVTVIFGLAEVLFTYALQSTTGRILLWWGYTAAVAAEAANYLLLSNLGYLNSLPLIAPGLLFGYAYYLARTRIVRSEIPWLLQS